ncbi:MAG: hypothetical protein K0B15_08980 [Lentimicrobium sp.]|nr:hypothetical protein [Lentimicrobium sp.]
MTLIKYKRVPLIRRKGINTPCRKLRFADNDTCKILLIYGNFTIDEIDRINSGLVKVKEDYSFTRQEMLDKIAAGYDPEIYFKI